VRVVLSPGDRIIVQSSDGTERLLPEDWRLPDIDLTEAGE
jgi:hypothetical protein